MPATASRTVDDDVLEMLDKAAVSYQIVLTKADQVKRGRAWRRASPRPRRRSPKHPAAYPDVLATSARNGAGIAELRAAIARLLAENAGRIRRPSAVGFDVPVIVAASSLRNFKSKTRTQKS